MNKYLFNEITPQALQTTLQQSSQLNDNTKTLDPKILVILMHGYGDVSSSYINIAEYWQKHHLSNAHYICLNAPQKFEGTPSKDGASQWYSLVDRSEESMIIGAKVANEYIVNFIQEQLKRLKLDFNHVVLAGFSQGAAMSLYTGLRLPSSLAIIGYSGYMIGREFLKQEIINKPQTLLIHGEDDLIVPVNACHFAENALKLEGVPVTKIIEQNLNHSISEQGLYEGGTFLKRIYDAFVSSYNKNF